MKNFIKKISAVIAVVLGTVVFAAPTFAATTASLTPVSLQVVPGQTFSVTITVDPHGTVNYVEKIALQYPADTLEVKSFTYAQNWMALNQPGYDVVDNTNGSMVKTAGYTGGITNPTIFGTVTFSAKKAGSAQITFGNASTAFEANSQTVITGNAAAVSIIAAVAKPVIVPYIKPATTSKTVVATTSVDKASSTDAVSPANSQSAAAGNVAATSNGGAMIWIISIIAVVLVGGVVYYITRKSKV